MTLTAVSYFHFPYLSENRQIKLFLFVLILAATNLKSKFAMGSLFCEQRLEENMKLLTHHWIFMITFCVLNLMFSVLTCLANLIVISALRKASSVPSNLKILFLSLAVADFAVGMCPQLMFGVIVAVMLHKNANGDQPFDLCSTSFILLYFFLFLLASASFLTILAIAVDRYLAVSLHLRYQELVTTNRIVLALISLWVTSVVTAALFVSLPNNNHLVVVIVEAVGFPVTTIAYIRIYMAVRYHQNRINSQMREGGHRLKVSIRERRAAINSLFFYVIFLACYTPHLCGTILLLTDSTSISYLVANHATLLLVILNSALNPLVYCWRYRQIRVYAINMIRKLLISRDSE